jgi:hypothetical protein
MVHGLVSRYSFFWTERLMRRGRPAPVDIVIERARGDRLDVVARRYDLTVPELSRVLADHSIYCFARIEPMFLQGREEDGKEYHAAATRP